MLIKKNQNNIYLTPNLNNQILIPTILPDITFHNNNNKYFTEILLITNTTNPYDLKLWIHWHLYYAQFDKITIIDNSNSTIIYNTCKKYDRIKYIKQSGKISQSDIYNNYVNNSEAEWVLPIDDDEFIYLGNFKSIKELIYYTLNKNNNTFKISFDNLFLYSSSLLETRKSDENIFELFNCYCPDISKLYYDNYVTIKTMCNTTIPHYYVIDMQKFNSIKYINLNKIIGFDISTINNDAMGNIHNPLTLNYNKNFIPAINTNYNIIQYGLYTNLIQFNNLNMPLLLHFKYKTRKEFIDKCKNNIFSDRSTEYYNICYTEQTFLNVYKLNKYFIKTNKFLNISKNLGF